jgi:hypothetical protein
MTQSNRYARTRSHTEAWGYRYRDIIAEVPDPSAAIRTYSVPLPNAQAALEYQQSVLGTSAGGFEITYSTCLTLKVTFGRQ